jgi:hypothetical protein
VSIARSNLFVCFCDRLNWRAEFASDSLLEGDGFELPVPDHKRSPR